MRRHNANKDNKWRELYIRQMRGGGDPSSGGSPHADRWRELYIKQMRVPAGNSNRYEDTDRAGPSHRGSDLYLGELHTGNQAMFLSMSQELKEEGNRLFQWRDYEGALIKYDKAIKLLPDSHADVSYLRSNMAECYIQLGIHEYPRAIHECTLALNVIPKYTKALLKRARCYEALDMLDQALADVRAVLKIEQNNIVANEIEARVRMALEWQGSRSNGIRPLRLVPLAEYVDDKSKEPKAPSENENAKLGNDSNQNHNKMDIERNPEDKLVVEEEKVATCTEDEPKRTVKLVFREEIRWAQIPLSCDILKLRKVIMDRFPNSKYVVVKFKDEDGDLVTITTTEELQWAQDSSTGHGSMKLYVGEADPSQDPFYNRVCMERHAAHQRPIPTEAIHHVWRRKEGSESTCISDWIVQFALFFKNYVGFDVDPCIDLHEVGIKAYSEAMEETVTSEEAQELFGLAVNKFQELAALALFNWGNVHMSRARRKVYFKEDSSRECVLEQIKNSYEWAQKEFVLAGERYEQALKIKPEFYEAVFALGQQQFEQAKLSWYYAVGTGLELEMWPSGEALMLYNNAEENMERGMRMWKDVEKQCVEEEKTEAMLRKIKMDGVLMSADEVEEQATNIRSQIYVLWGTMLYERSIMEFKLGLPVWNECLEAAVEKFEHAGASHTDIAVMIKNHCSNDTGIEGLGFNIDEIVQAWNEMYEAKKWQKNMSCFRLEPLLRRRVSKLYYALEGA